MRVFLTGISGYLGTILAEQLSDVPEIEEITGIDMAPYLGPLPKKVRLVKLDIRSPEITSVMKGHDVVVHTAFMVTRLGRMPKLVRDDLNINGAGNMARAAIANKVRRFIYPSSYAAYDPILARGQSDVTEDFPIGKGDSFSYYCNAKAVTERIFSETIPQEGITLTIFRPIYVMGPNNRTIIPLVRSNFFRLVRSDPRSQYVHEVDAAAAFKQAVLTDMPGAYNLSPNDFLHLSDVHRLLGIRKTPILPVGVARFAVYANRNFHWSPQQTWLTIMLEDSPTLDNAKLKATGWTPTYNCSETLVEALKSPKAAH